jgi:hypothetical protein
MKIDDTSLQVKRNRKKTISTKIGIMLKEYAEQNYPKDKRFVRKMLRQIRCSSYIEVLENGSVISHYCKEKTCLVCNSIRAAKFLDKYKSNIEKRSFIYHNVLSIKNPNDENLKKEIDKMFKFFNQSSIKRDKRFKELNKSIGFVRTFETTFNSRAKTYNIHFHCLLAGEVERDVIEYGNILIGYWLKYFGEKANRKGQYLEKQEKSILENFKYLFKLKDITKKEIPMLYEFLKAVNNKRLFSVKNIEAEKKDKSDYKNQKLKDLKSDRVQNFHYNIKAKNWIDPKTGEIFIDVTKEKKYEEEMRERKNLRELKEYFRQFK